MLTLASSNGSDVYVCTVYRYPTPNMAYHRRALVPYFTGVIDVQTEFTNANNPEQAWARNQYLEELPVGAYALIIDSDEWFTGDFRVLRKLYFLVNSVWQVYGTHGGEWRPRIIKKVDDYLYYIERHDNLRSANVIIDLWHGCYAQLPQISFINDRTRVKNGLLY